MASTSSMQMSTFSGLRSADGTSQISQVFGHVRIGSFRDAHLVHPWPSTSVS